jgi:CHAT domain-containing protein
LLVVETGFSQSNKYISLGEEYIKKGDSLTDADEPLKGLVYYNLAKKLYEKNQDLERQAYLYRYLVRHLDIAGKYQEAAVLLKKGEFLLENKCKTKPDSIAFWIYSKLGAEYQRLEKFDSCNIYYEKTNNILKHNNKLNNRGVCFFLANVGTYEMTYGNYALAHDYYVKSLSIIERDINLTMYKSAILSNYIRCLSLESKNDLALKYTMQLLEINKDSPMRYNHILTAGISYYDRKDYINAQKQLDNALKIYKEQKKIAKENENLDFEKMYFDATAGVFFKQNRFDDAEKAVQKSIILTKKIYGSKGYDMAESYRLLGRIKLKQNKIAESLNLIQQSIIVSHLNFSSNNIYDNPPIENTNYNWVMFRALDAKSEVLFEKYKQQKQIIDLRKAFETAKLATQLAIQIRKSYQSSNQKSSFTEYFYPFYSRNIEIANTLFSITHDKKVFDVGFDFNEKMKATALVDIVSDIFFKPQNIDIQLLQSEKKLHQKITNAENNLIAVSDSLEAQKMQAKLANYRLELNELLKEIEHKSPNYYKLKYGFNQVAPQVIQTKVLDPQTVLISYVVTDKNLFVFLITNSKSNIYRQSIDSDFIKKLKSFRNHLANSPQGKKYNAQALSSEIYEVLIKPIEKEIENKKRLIIIRDAELNYLPFEVLAKQKDDFLLKKYIISYAYSASLLLPTEQPRKQGSGLLGFAPFVNNSFQQSLFRDKSLGQLPKSGNEVEKIGGDIYLENEATKKRFYEEYRDKNIIHFATHAITDDNDPLKSFVAFYPNNADYKLFTNELYDLDLRNTSLVMLSACETGAGKLQKGEGVMSLSRAFTYAGAKAVITTLWNAHDEASAYISERFYKHLKDGLKTDEALQKAKLDFLDSDLALRYEHPYYWANFILIGPAETIDFSTNWWVLGIGIAIIILVIFAFYRRMVTNK